VLTDHQLAEITFFDGYTVDRAVRDPEALITADREIGCFDMPPWGFFGESFDLSKYLTGVISRGPPASDMTERPSF
jgi:hypothetical protein